MIISAPTDGRKGVAHLHALITEEMQVVMTLMGARSVAPINRDSLARRIEPGEPRPGEIAKLHSEPSLRPFLDLETPSAESVGD